MVKSAILQNVFEGLKEEAKEGGKVVFEQIGVAKKTAKQNVPVKPPSREEDLEWLYGEAKPPDQENFTQKEAEKEKRLEALRQRLHSEYYQKLVSSQKPKEERPVEKVEREKREERWELEQRKTKKPKPLPLGVAKGIGTGEKYRGISG